MRCGSCQAENTDSATFCMACGQRLRETRSASVPSASAPSAAPLDAGEAETSASPPQVLPVLSVPDGEAETFFSPPAITSGPQVPAGEAETHMTPSSRGAAPHSPSRAGTGPGLAAMTGSQVLPEGTDIGQRYRVVRLLGRGGMGAVYLVHDQELSRDVALKIIRPDLADNPEALARFKREITLSSQVTNRHVLRVYDLGEADGVKFVTLQYIDGEDLAARLRREGRQPAAEIERILRMICEGLGAAHDQGVIHRDLKPQNIMLDRAGGVYVTDFGLAKLLGQTGVTETGMLVGTPFYMSPEQVKGQGVDHRTDIYSVGVILYEMATGKPPFTEGSAFEVMMQRLQRAPRPLAETSPDLPPRLSAVIDRSLAVEPSARYQSCREILAELDRDAMPRRRPARSRQRLQLAAVGVAALGALAAGSFWLLKERRPPAAGSEVASRTVLVADFENRTGDAVLDGTMESVFGLALEEASFINSYSRTAARRIAEQVQPGSTGLGEAAARLVAVREGISVVTSGAIERSADGYRISARALDAVTGKPLLEAQVDVSRRDEVLAAANKLAARVRRALGDTTPESAQLAAGETFTAASVEAAHEYALGQEAFALGRWGEAEAHYKKAVELDPNLGRAYAGMAAVHANQGRRQEADRWFREAMARISRMSDREKYRTRGLYFVVSREGAKAAEQFEDLLKRYPADTAATANLALAHFYRRDMAQALAVGRRAVELSPRNVPQKNNLALYAMYAGDFEEAARQFEEVLKLNPSFDVAFVGLGLSQLALGRVDEAAATYGRLATLGERGASRAAMALADLALYEGRLAEAIPQLEKGIALDEKQADPDGAATKLVALAEVERLRGRERQARAAVDRAVSLSRGENVTLPAALVYLGLGAQDRAIALADELGRRLEPDPQAYAGIIWGEARRRRGQAREAVKAFEDARKLADTWIGRVGLARAYLEARAFTEAHAELENAMRRRGEATALFLDEMPTFSVFPPLYVDLARAEIGLNDPAAPDSLRTFLAIRATADGDPLVAEARRLLTSAAPVR